MQDLTHVVGWVARGLPHGEQVPDVDGLVLTRVVEEMHQFLPEDAGWWWQLESGGGQTPKLTCEVRERIEARLAEMQALQHILVRGEYVRANIERQMISVRHPPTGRTFRVRTPPDVLRELSNERDVWVEVEGLFKCDIQGRPLEVTGTPEVRLPDLSPITLDELELRAGTLVFKPPMRLPVTLDSETHQSFQVLDEELALEATGAGRDELIEDLERTIAFLWSEYAEWNPDDLTRSARELQEAWRAVAHLVRRGGR